MAETKMKCPFRTDENGEFKDCYGEKCMAHFYVPGAWSVNPEGGYGQASIPNCKKLENNNG